MAFFQTDFYIQNNTLENAKSNLNMSQACLDSPQTASTYCSPKDFNSSKCTPTAAMNLNESPFKLEIGYNFYFIPLLRSPLKFEKPFSFDRLTKTQNFNHFFSV